MAQFDFEGYNVYYETHGEGEPILILNGIMMSTASWTAFIPEFSRHNKVILVDFLDQGKSTRMKEGYTHDIQVRLVEALREHLGIEKWSIMGISYGSEIAIQYAIRYPDRARKLMLFNAAGRTSKWLKKIGDGWNEAAKSGNGYAYYLTTIPVIYSTKFFEDNAEWMDNREETLTQYFSRKDVQESLIRLTNSSVGYDMVDRLCEIKCPTLIVSGSEDALLPITEQQLLHEKIKGSVYVTINGSGHASMYENPSAYTALVTGFANLADTPIKI